MTFYSEGNRVVDYVIEDTLLKMVARSVVKGL